jgi:hypothetical protein
MKNKIELSLEEAQAIINHLAQIPTQYGAGLYQFFLNKVSPPKDQAEKPAEE